MSEWSGYDGRESRALGGVRLPCGASPRFSPFRRIDLSYSPPGGRCAPLCGIQHQDCQAGCERRLKGASDEARGGCFQRCLSASTICHKGCR